MRIQHNIMAMNAYRNYNTNTSALSKNLEKLSSGYKINRAGDDAAGLAISEKMRAQITGLNAAQKNVKDGISLVKTAEGDMQEIQDMLNRMDYLATQSANGTYDDPVDRKNLQKEVDALRSEIDRIADSANFNGINLLDGSQSATTTVTTTEAVEAEKPALDLKVSTDATKTVDGKHPTAAQRAEYTITLGATADTLDFDGDGTADVTPGVTKAEDLLGLACNGGKLSDYFKLQDDTGADVADATVLSADKTYTLVAKNPGAQPAAVATLLNGVGANNGSSIAQVNAGADEGADAQGTKAEYSLTFDFTNLAGGQTFQIGDEKFEISTSGTAIDNTANLIDLSGVDLTIAGTADTTGAFATSDATGQTRAAELIQKAISDAFGTDFDVDDAPTAAVTGNKFELNMVAKNAESATGTSYNLGDVRVSETNSGDDYTGADGKAAITGTYNPGQVGAPGQAGTFAKVTYEGFDLSKLAVGDKISIYGQTVEVVEKAEDADLNAGKLTLDDAKDSGKFIAAFERMFRDSAGNTNSGNTNFGKLEITGTELTITDAQDVGRTSKQLQEDVGLKFTPGKELDPGKDATSTTTVSGGLTLQIGDTSEKYNQLSVSIGDMHVKSMGTTYNVTTDADGKEVRTENIVDGKLSVVGDKSIEKIDISTQKGAPDAIDVIRDAINYVSSIRGDLGAVQNRLEHTANNLSVMAENIQDAESTIRDTDVAEEMMAYTKNNILVQSAQAMLAQANAVPQGVLQLLG